MIKWISVKEYLPPFDLPVLVFPGIAPYMFVGIISSEGAKPSWVELSSSYFRPFKLTDYWAKINLPEEEKDNDQVD